MLDLGQQISVYRIKEILSEKATHTCCLTEDPFFHSSVLLKIYPVNFLKNEQQRKHFETQLEKVLLLEHSSIAPIFDSGFEGEYFYYTTNYNYNAPLLEQTKQGLSSEKALKIVRELGSALKYAVERGLGLDGLVIENIYFGDDDQVVITDFGIEYIFKCFTENLELEWSEELALLDLGRFQLQLLRPSNKDNLGREFELISGIENQELQKLTERFFTENQDRYQSLSELIDAIDVVLEQPPVETRPMVQHKSIAVSSDVGITDQQRDQVLPHVRQLISEKNLYKNLLDEAQLDQNKIKDQLKEALLKLDQFTQPQLVAPENRTSRNRNKVAAWIFVGFAFGVIFTGSYGYSLQQKKNKQLVQGAIVEKQIDKAQTEAAILKVSTGIVEKTAADKIPLSIDKLVGEEMITPSMLHNKDIPVIVEQEQPWLPLGQEFSNVEALVSESVDMGMEAGKEELAAADREDLLNNLFSWSDAWSQQNSGVYFSHYSEQYRPELGTSRQDWLRSRMSRLQRPAWIKVQIENIRVRQLAVNRAQIKFMQDYHSDFYQDQIWKSLNLIKENGMWKILTERSLGRVEVVAKK